MNTDASYKSGVTWGELFISLLYAGTLLLFLAWIGDWDLKKPPEALVKVLGSGWSWAISATGGALITLIFRNRISRWAMVWTICLIVVLGVGAYELRVPKPIPPEHWHTTEGKRADGSGPAFQNDWEVRFNGDTFQCAPNPDFGPNNYCRAAGWGNVRAVERYQSANNNMCTFFGRVEGDTVTGDYHCNIGGTFRWSATISPSHKMTP